MQRYGDLGGIGGNPQIRERLSGGASAIDVTLNTGAGTQVNDVLVVFHGNNYNIASNMLAPTGTAGTWTQRALGDNGTNTVHIKIWTRKVTVGGAQTVTLSPTIDGEELTVHLFVVMGADPDNPVDAAAGNNGASSTSHTAPAINPSTPNALLLCGAQSGSVVDYTPPNEMVEETEVDITSFITGATASQSLSAAGDTATRTFTASQSSVFATATIAIRATSGGTGWTVDPTDDTGLTDTTTQDLQKVVDQTDPVGLTDTAALEQQYVTTDSAGLTDNTAVTQANELTDGAGLTDTATQDLLKLVQATDDAGLTDTANIEQGKAATDLAGLTDTAAVQQAKVATDNTGLTDTSTLELAKLVAQTDIAGLTDTTALSRTLGVSDTTGLTDAAALTRHNVHTDTAGLTDTATTDLTKTVTATDPAGLTDTTAYTLTFAPIDDTGLTDTATTAHTQVATHTDLTGLTDTALAQLVAAFTPAHIAVEAHTAGTALLDAHTTTRTGALDG